MNAAAVFRAQRLRNMGEKAEVDGVGNEGREGGKAGRCAGRWRMFSRTQSRAW